MSSTQSSPPAAAPVTIITAGANGIGGATAVAFADAGHRLVLADIDAEALAAMAETLPTEVVTVVADVTDPDRCQAVIDTARDRWGRIDNLVNVVGGSRAGKTVLDLPLEEWNLMLSLNLTSTFLMCKAALPDLIEARGSIVNVSSGAGIRGMKANPGYVAAKAGIVGLTRAMAIDHGEHVRVNGVAPGPIRTPLMRRNRTPEEIAEMGSLAVMGRIGEPEEIADCIVWLASDAASYVMGQVIEVDGGPATAI